MSDAYLIDASAVWRILRNEDDLRLRWLPFLAEGLLRHCMPTRLEVLFGARSPALPCVQTRPCGVTGGAEFVDGGTGDRGGRYVPGSLAERLRSGERVDVVAEMARPVPTLVIARLLGIPTTDHPQFSDWSDGMVKAAEGRRTPVRRAWRTCAWARRPPLPSTDTWPP